MSAPIPPEYAWKTNDGRTLDIRWMDTVHLTHSVNMVIRKADLTRQVIRNLMTAPETKIKAGNKPFVNMLKELNERKPIEWHQPNIQGELYDQVIVYPQLREDIKTMCLLRAMLDTNIYHPNVVSREEALRTLRQAPESVFLSLEQHMTSNPHPDLHRLMARFVAYRLERT